MTALSNSFLVFRIFVYVFLHLFIILHVILWFPPHYYFISFQFLSVLFSFSYLTCPSSPSHFICVCMCRRVCVCVRSRPLFCSPSYYCILQCVLQAILLSDFHLLLLLQYRQLRSWVVPTCTWTRAVLSTSRAQLSTAPSRQPIFFGITTTRYVWYDTYGSTAFRSRVTPSPLILLLHTSLL